MTDTWDADDGSDDEWDVDDDDEIDARLGLKKVEQALPTFDDEQDLALAEKADRKKAEFVALKKKGTALAARKAAEKERAEELELARKAVELEAEAESNLSASELKARRQGQMEEADAALAEDLFDTVDGKTGSGAAASNNDKLVMKTIVDHLKQARRVAECLRGHGKIHMATAFFKECLEQSQDVLDDAAISDIIKTCNVIKNAKVQAAKRKVKGQAQKAKKVDKQAEAKARQVQLETFGDNDQYDAYDEMGHDYEDAFF